MVAWLSYFPRKQRSTCAGIRVCTAVLCDLVLLYSWVRVRELVLCDMLCDLVLFSNLNLSPSFYTRLVDPSSRTVGIILFLLRTQPGHATWTPRVENPARPRHLDTPSRKPRIPIGIWTPKKANQSRFHFEQRTPALVSELAYHSRI